MRKRAFLAFVGTAALAGSGLAIAPGALAATGPGVGAGMARGITDTSAVLVAAIGPGGQATTYAFQYGTTTQYPGQTAVHSVGPPITYKTVTAEVAGLLPGTTYHFRVLATNASGTNTGSDVTFRTAGLARLAGVSPLAVTGEATAIDAHDALLTGMLNPSSSNVRYYFQLGTRQPYELQTISQTLRAGRALAVRAPVSGLQSNQIFHYRLVAVNENGEMSAGSDQSFLTAPGERLNPSALEVRVSPAIQRRLPDVVTVSGRLVPPRSLSGTAVCQGFVDVVFRVRTIAIQTLRAGIQKDCKFALRVRFSVRRRLLGGHVLVHVLFPGNPFLHRLEAPTHAIQIG